MENFFAKFKDFFRDRRGESKVSILRSPLFLLVLGFKIAASFLFASDFLTRLFARFVNYFVISGFQNPYEFFYRLKELTIFPYGQVMLWLLALPRWLFNPFLSADYDFVSNFHIFVYRLPILLADVVILLILARWLKNQQKKVLIYYWCSPILFYISYLHGQLDVLPIVFLFSFLYFLFKEKLFWAFSVLGLAIAAKASILIAWPFAVVFLILKRVPVGRLLLLAAIPLALFFLLNLNWLLAPGFAEIVLNNREQLKIFDFHYRFSDHYVIYFVPLAYLILLIKSLTYRTFNRDIFLMFLGFSFGILTLFIPPMPGWYFWVIPFFAYFYISQNNAPRFSFILLNIFYFLYFFIRPDADFFQIFQPISLTIAAWPNFYSLLGNWGIDADLAANIAFTLLQAALLLNILWIYRRGIESNIQYKIKYQPYLIGLAGDSGSGKTTLVGFLKDIFGEKNVAVLEGDDLHKWERGNEMWREFTHLNLKANDLYLGLADAADLKNGSVVERRHYDHDSGKFTLPKKFAANKIIIFEGLHSLFLNQMRNLHDLKVFLNTDEELRRHWKVLRDMKERGYSREKILEQLAQREADSEKYIRAQEQYADIAIVLRNKEAIADLGNEAVALDIVVEFKCLNDVNLEPLLRRLAAAGDLAIEHLFFDNYQLAKVSGPITADIIGEIAEDLIPDLREVIGSEPHWLAGDQGLRQLFLCYYIFEKMKIDRYGR